MLIHQLPPTPAYLRVKISRRLAKVGAVALKNSVYVLPNSDTAIEDLQWVRKEILEGKGDATICDARLIDGVSDSDIEASFREARDEEYDAIVKECSAGAKALGRGKLTEEKRAAGNELVARIERRIEQIREHDFFGAAGGERAIAALGTLRARLNSEEPATVTQRSPSEQYENRVWVTRVGIHVDRIASAWLIRRFIDPKPTFKFVPPKGYAPEAGELRFDMFEAEFSHEGDKCTFEVLCERFGLREPGLRAVAEIIHDIDVKDDKFTRPETAGFAAQIAGLALRHRDDEARLSHGSELLEQLLAYFARKSS